MDGVQRGWKLPDRQGIDPTADYDVSKIRNDYVSAMFLEGCGLAGPVDTHHEAEVALARSLDTSERILEDHCVRRVDPEERRCLDKHIWRRLSLEVLLSDIEPVNLRVK